MIMRWQFLRVNWAGRKKTVGRQIQRAEAEQNRKHARARTNMYRELQRIYKGAVKSEEIAFRKHIDDLDAVEKCLNELSSQLESHETKIKRHNEVQRESRKNLATQLQKLQIDTQKELDQLTRRSQGVHASANKRCNDLAAQLQLLSSGETL